MNTSRSQQLMQAARALLPGGVDSPVRAFKAVGGDPFFVERGAGAYLYDVDGNRYVDYVMSWGPLILGHAPDDVVRAVAEAAARGTSYGAPTEAEVLLASLVQRFMPNLEMIRFVNSGTEATMSALRLARAATGRNKIVKCEGCYHGHADSLLVKAGSGMATLGLPDSPGVPPGTALDTLVVPFNDLNAVRTIFAAHAEEIAAMIVEPVGGNMGVVPPGPGFLQALRTITADAGALLVFDEVMTGFRVHPGGAQTLYGVKPDLTTLGKVIGGGLPVGAYGGPRDLMEMVAPAGPVYQAGTLSGNPLAMAAGIATLTALTERGAWEAIDSTAMLVAMVVANAAGVAGVPIVQNRVGTMFSTFFTDQPVTDWTSASASDTDRYARFFRAMLERGVFFAPSQFEAAFASAAHGEEALAITEQAAAAAMGEVGGR